jgi:anti-anti-sigma regulatory factor
VNKQPEQSSKNQVTGAIKQKYDGCAFGTSTRSSEIVITSVSFELTKIRLLGELIAGDSADSLRRAFQPWYDVLAVRRLEVDVAGLTVVDGVGLLALENVALDAEAVGTQFAITHVSDQFQDAISELSSDIPMVRASLSREMPATAI